MMALSPVFVN